MPLLRLTALVLVLFLSIGMTAQTQTNKDTANQTAEKKPLDQPDGQPLSVTVNVRDNVNVEAELLPPGVAKRLFGGTIGRNYAAVELIVSNRSSTSAFVLQSAFLDYSDWLLNGVFAQDNSHRLPLTPYQAGTQTAQVASTEARLVRGDLQERQPWSGRNSFVNAITAIGTVAVGYQFLATSTPYIKGISAFSGVVVPAVAAFWPDQTQFQLNRISDFGFRTDQIVAKQSSQIIVAFYPIDRFLTPQLKKAYLKSPAFFFVPGSVLTDKKNRHFLLDPMRSVGIFKSEQKDDEASAEISKAILCSPGVTCESDSTDAEKMRAQYIRNFIEKISLNKIRIVVSGIMTVDVNAVPANISSVDFDPSLKLNDAASWKSGAKLSGTITGTFLGGGVPSIAEATALGIGPIAVDANNSDDNRMAFSFSPVKDITKVDTLTFVVTKTVKDGSTTTSLKFVLKINYQAQPVAAPVVASDKAAPSASLPQAPSVQPSLPASQNASTPGAAPATRPSSTPPAPAPR